MTETETTELNEEKLYELIKDEYSEGGLDGLEIGELDGDVFYIFQSWSDVAYCNGILNDFIGAPDPVYLTSGQTYSDLLAEKQKELDKNPDSYRLKSEIKRINETILYRQHIAIREKQGIEELSIDDFGVEWGFSDEYSRCDCGSCDLVVRTSPDSYSWTPPLYIDDCGVVADECAADGSFDEEILEQYKNEAKSLPDARDTDDLGLVQINEESFQNGWYGGQCDEPQPIIEALNNKDIDVWFKVYPRQFDLDFDVYVKAEDQEKAKRLLVFTDTEADEDPAEVLKRGLKAASEGMKELQGDGIKHATINSDGTATIKEVSKEDFIDGKF